jgi:putative sterol carrier protein
MPGVTQPLYWSDAYSRALVEAFRKDPDFQKAARKFDDTIVLRCLDAPTEEGNGKEDVEAVYRIRHGEVTLTRRAEPAPSRALRDAPFDKGSVFARTTAPYALWARLDRGEMNVLQALASPDYVVEGPKLKIMANIGLFNAMSAVASRLPKRFA